LDRLGHPESHVVGGEVAELGISGAPRIPELHVHGPIGREHQVGLEFEPEWIAVLVVGPACGIKGGEEEACHSLGYDQQAQQEDSIDEDELRAVSKRAVEEGPRVRSPNAVNGDDQHENRAELGEAELAVHQEIVHAEENGRQNCQNEKGNFPRARRSAEQGPCPAQHCERRNADGAGMHHGQWMQAGLRDAP
jgi:hypothetical protein